MVFTSAEAELALRRASSSGMIRYQAGDTEFDLTDLGESNLTKKTKRGTQIYFQFAIIMGGGLVGLLSDVVFRQLSQIVSYPVHDENHWVDGEGRPLPGFNFGTSGDYCERAGFSGTYRSWKRFCEGGGCKVRKSHRSGTRTNLRRRSKHFRQDIILSLTLLRL